jgi:hypothetical protein
LTDLLIDLCTSTTASTSASATAPESSGEVPRSGGEPVGAVMPGRRRRIWRERHERITAAIGVLGAGILFGVTVLGAVHSYDAVRRGAEGVFGPGLMADTFPLLADGVIAGATFRYVSLLRRGRYVRGWRLLAHTGIGATVYLNAAVAATFGQVPWHVVAPVGFSVLIELWAKEAIGELQELTGARREAIPLWLWISDPRLARRARMQLARTSGTSFRDAVREVHRVDVALQVLALALPGEDKPERTTRARLARWIRHGVLPTSSVLEVAGLSDPDLDPSSLPPAECLLRATFAEVLSSPGAGALPTAPVAPVPVPVTSAVPATVPARAAATVRVPEDVAPASPVVVCAAASADVTLPRAMTDAEKTALRWALRELAERGERISVTAVQDQAARVVPSVALRTRRAIGSFLRSQTAATQA